MSIRKENGKSHREAIKEKRCCIIKEPNSEYMDHILVDNGPEKKIV